MTLDEAIKTEENIAKENQRIADTGIVFDDITIDMLYCDTEVIEEHLANYQRCAEEHKQLAEWLKELKQLREQTRWIPVSERLPNINDYIGCSKVWQKEVLIKGYLSFDDKKELFISEASVENVIHDCVPNTVIVSWMPLPKL